MSNASSTSLLSAGGNVKVTSGYASFDGIVDSAGAKDEGSALHSATAYSSEHGVGATNTVMSPAIPHASVAASALAWLSRPLRTLLSPSAKSFSLSHSYTDIGDCGDGVASSNVDGAAAHQHRHRLVDRQREFHQSNGSLHVRRRIQSSYWRSLYGSDMFHTIINAPTWRSVSLLLLAYFLVVVVFAAVFYCISVTYDCNLGLNSFADAFLFSLETMATVGYGTKDIFFDDCYLPMVFLTLQLLVRVFADAVVIGVIYARLARPTTRASTVLFSDRAVIRRIRGKLYFMLQLCELRQTQLVEAHVRLYVVKKEPQTQSHGGAGARAGHTDTAAPKTRNFFQISHMHLNHPNDDLGGMLFMCLPQVVVHELDASSPLMPPPVWEEKRDVSAATAGPAQASRPVKRQWRPPTYDFAATKGARGGTGAGGVDGEYDKQVLSELAFPSVSVRNPHAAAGGAAAAGATDESSGLDEYAAFFCGSGAAHAQYGCASGADVVAGTETSRQWEETRMVQSYMADRCMEVIAVVEGVDSATGGNVQCRHSYVFTEVQWDQTFTPCVYEGEEAGVPIVDFTLFHELQPVGADAPFPGNVASIL